MKEKGLFNVENILYEKDALYGSNEGISTDLMPTLLSMYDAMYAKLSMTSEHHVNDELETNKSRPCEESPSQLTDTSIYNNVLDSTRVDPISEGSCDSCGSQCECKQNQFIKTDSPLIDSARIQVVNELEIRPLSSISSSSSSCSYNSTPRGTAGSCMASVESLEESNSLQETTRRRDRKVIKARREKLRTGSSDSGVHCHIISLPEPSILRRRYCQPDLSYMDRIVLEILETEELYVRDLEEVIEGYLNYWKANPQPEIKFVELENLFSNIEEIYRFNREFLNKLSLCGTDPVSVAQCFVRHNRGFTIYTDYCTNYPRTVNILTNLMRKEESMRSCRERQLALGHTLPLGSYLLKPVQRVLKYHLLLGNIIKNFPKEKSGYDDIWDALSAMTGMAHHINDMKKRHEHAVRVQEIQSLLYGWSGEDLTTFGELAAEGTFRTHGHKGVRHVFLFDKMLLITKKKDQNILVYKSHILCSNLMLIEAIPGEPLSFHAIPFDNPRLQNTLACRSHEQKREWTQQLKRVILENYDADIPAHARQIVMELGQAKSDDLNNIETRISRRTHHAPEYLQKRKDRRRTSEIGIKGNKSPPRKKFQNRSSSCTRSSTRKISASSLSPFELKQLRLPLWRRRSELAVDAIPRDFIQNAESSQSIIKDKLEVCDTESQSESYYENTTNENEKSNEISSDSTPVKEENLHDIVTHLLQHRLEMQKKILNKQRRTIISKKQVSCNASDTDDERPPLPISPPPTDIRDSNRNTELVTASFNNSYNSHSQNEPKSNDDEESVPRDVNSNYNNVNEIWDTLWSQIPPGESANSTIKGQVTEINNLLMESTIPKSVVSTESAIDAYNILNNYLEQSKLKEINYKFPYKVPETNGNPEYIYDSDEDDCFEEIHPNHKIYKRLLPLNKGNIRKILGRLASPRSHHKSNSELSSVSGRSIDSCSIASTKTSIVSTVAKHYSKALMEKVRQITHDDNSKKMDNNSIGARLASSHEHPDYAVPNIKTCSSSRPDSVLSSSSFRTCSSSSSGLLQQKPNLKSKYMDEILTDASAVGDSYYERCFDATEFENDLFRDSAIYSDPEDTDVSLSPLSSFRIRNSHRKLSPINMTPNIIRQSSFRHSYNFGSDSSNIQRPSKVAPPPVTLNPAQNDIIIGETDRTQSTVKHSVKLNRTSTIYNSVRITSSRSESRKTEFVLKNGWVKHIVDKLQDQKE